MGVFELLKSLLEFGLDNMMRIGAFIFILAIEGETLVKSLKKPKKTIVSKPPGANLNMIGEFVYSKKTYERIFQQIIANMQDEYFEALYENKEWKALWVRVRGTWSFWAAAVMQVPVSSSRLIKKIWTLVG